jgi:hypothetical protein
MPVLTATFDPAWAAVNLVVDGTFWSGTVNTVTITRQVAGESDFIVRGVNARVVVGGTLVATDHEAPLGSTVTYKADGYNNAAFVQTVSVTVSTTGAATGLWLKVAGQPDMTVMARLRGMSAVSSPTIGGVYQIAGGGGSVAQTAAQWSGIESDEASLGLSIPVADVGRLRMLLATSRVVLLQPVGSSDLDAGWYFVGKVDRINPAQTESYGRRWFELDVQRTGVPSGTGAGISGVTWAVVKERYATWTALMAGEPTWFDVLKGV